MGFRKGFKEQIIADLSILDVIRMYKPEALSDQNGREFPLRSDGKVMSIRCPKPTHEDKNPSCTINIEDKDKFKANTGHCFSCNDSFSSLDLAIKWLEYRGEVEPPPPDLEKRNGDPNYYKKVEKVLDIFGLDKSKYYEYNTDYRRNGDYIPFFTSDELNALGINSTIKEENKKNIIIQRIPLEDYVNHSLRMSGKQEFVDTQIQVSDFFHKDPKSKKFVFTDKVPDEKQKVFLDEARHLLIYHSSEYENGKIFLDFAYKDIIRSKAFETATEKLHEAYRHQTVLASTFKELCGVPLKETTDKWFESYYNSVVKSKPPRPNLPEPTGNEYQTQTNDKYKSLFLAFGEHKYSDYTYSTVILLDKGTDNKGKMKMSCSIGTTDKKHSPDSIDEYKADFRYSTEKSNVPLFQSKQEYDYYHSIYTSLVNNYNSYQQRYFQLVKDNSHNYFTVKGEPFVMPPPPSKMQDIAKTDSVLSSIEQQRCEIMCRVTELMKAERQKGKEYASGSIKFLATKEPQVQYTVKNGNLYSGYIENAEDWYKKDKEFFESLVEDRIATVREDCNRRIDKFFAQTTALAEELDKVKSPDKAEDDRAVKYYLRYCEMKKQKADLSVTEPYKDIIEKGKIIYNNSLFLEVYSKDMNENYRTLALVKSAEEKLNKIQVMRSRKEEKETPVNADMPDYDEQTGVEQE